MNYLKYRINESKHWIRTNKDNLILFGFYIGSILLYTVTGAVIGYLMSPNGLVLSLHTWFVGALLGVVGWFVSMLILSDYWRYKEEQHSI